MLAHWTSSAEHTCNLTRLLLCLRASTWPLNDDILFGLCVSGERESNTGESCALRTSSVMFSTSLSLLTHKINADNQLRLAAVVSFDLCQASSVQRIVLRRTVAVSLLLLLLLHGVARRSRCLLLLAIHVLLVLRSVGVSTAGVDGRWWHWARRSALVRMRRTEVVALVSVLVRRRAAERLLWVHGQ